MILINIGDIHNPSYPAIRNSGPQASTVGSPHNPVAGDFAQTTNLPTDGPEADKGLFKI
jgi:hypothetical protein